MLIKNPFYTTGNSKEEIKQNNSSVYQNDLLAICLKEDTQSNEKISKIYDEFISQNDYRNLSEYFILIRVNNNLITNKFHSYTSLVIKRDDIEQFNFNNIELNDEEIILPILDVTRENIKIYNNIYGNGYNIEDLFSLVFIFKYYECNQDFAYKNIRRFIMSLNNSDYWSNRKNISLKLIDNFNERTFNFGNKSVSDKFLKELIQTPNSKSNKFDNYIEKIINEEDNISVQVKETQDIQHQESELVYNEYKKRFQSKYYINNNFCILKEQVTELIQFVQNDKKLLFIVFNAFLLNKQYSHLVLNNKIVLEIMEPFFTNFNFLYNYLVSYPWFSYLKEESIKQSRVTIHDRMVFDIDTANKLPFFPYDHKMINKNGYCPVTISSDILSNNFHGLSAVENYCDYGIDTNKNFKNKLNCFITGTCVNIFEGIETTSQNSTKWKHFAITGSVMPACVQKKSPLMDLVCPDNKNTWNSFFDQYYTKSSLENGTTSDIDVMCNCNNLNDYIEKTIELFKTIKTNIFRNFDLKEDDTEENIATLTDNKVTRIHIYRDYVEKYMSHLGTFDDIKKNTQQDNIRDFIYEKYIDFKIKQLEDKNETVKSVLSKIESNEMIQIFVEDEVNKKNVSSTNKFSVYVSDFLDDYQEISDEENKILYTICENVKFKIKSPYLKRDIEIFQINYEEFFSCVARFHLPCVRAFYNGETVYMLPSFITAMMTFTNIDYKYSSGMKNPIEIINKYRFRGFGTILNKREKEYVRQYNLNANDWKVFFQNNPIIGNNYNIDNPIFQPLKYFDKESEYFYNKTLYKKVNKKVVPYIGHSYQLNNMWYSYMLQTVDNKGNLQPLKQWIIDAYYDLIR